MRAPGISRFRAFVHVGFQTPRLPVAGFGGGFSRPVRGLVNALALLVPAGLGLGLGLAVARRPRAWRAATLSGLGLVGLAAVWGLLSGATLVWPGAGAVPAPAWFALRLDPLSAFFLLLVAVVGGWATVYAGEYWSDPEHPASAPWGRGVWNGFWASLVLVLLAGNGILFLIAWELFAVSAFFLITLNRAPRAVRAAGWLYLGASHAGTLCLFAFFASLAAATGGWMLGPMRDRADLAPLFWLALAGFGLKAGVFPLHIWLPSAHANAPSHVSACLLYTSPSPRDS